MAFLDFVKSLIPLGKRKREHLRSIKSYLGAKEYKEVSRLARQRKIGFHYATFGTTKAFYKSPTWPQLSLAQENPALQQKLASVNQKVEDKLKVEAFKKFAPEALDRIGSLIAPNLLGLEEAKLAAAVQLFTKDPIHILLLGDPGTGKTEILRSIEELAPQALFSLGSGASKAGLVGSYQGKEFIPGVLVEADQGTALLDELNLLKKEDRGGLYSAMEKGFVTYDKKGRHERHKARVRILATANPKGDKFLGTNVEYMKSQLPFEDALLSRFHLVFIVRKPGLKQFEKITRKIVKDEMKALPSKNALFVREYIEYVRKLNVTFDGKFESMIVDLMERLKQRENLYLVEVTPRLVLGVIRLAKAIARARLSRNTNADDVERAMKLLEAALKSGEK